MNSVEEYAKTNFPNGVPYPISELTFAITIDVDRWIGYPVICSPC